MVKKVKKLCARTQKHAKVVCFFDDLPYNLDGEPINVQYQSFDMVETNLTTAQANELAKICGVYPSKRQYTGNVLTALLRKGYITFTHYKDVKPTIKGKDFIESVF